MRCRLLRQNYMLYSWYIWSSQFCDAECREGPCIFMRKLIHVLAGLSFLPREIKEKLLMLTEEMDDLGNTPVELMPGEHPRSHLHGLLEVRPAKTLQRC